MTRPPLFEGGYNQVLVRYGDFLKELAASEKLGIADLNTSVVAALAKANTLDPPTAAKILPDRVHPAAAGHLLMAAALLKAWNAPGLVSSVELDSGRKDADEAVQYARFRPAMVQGCLVDATGRSLPMPVDRRDALAALALRSSDFTATLNQQPLRVRGLASGRYSLRIDGESAGTFTSEELAAGINLAELPTPMSRQAAQVHALTLRHNEHSLCPLAYGPGAAAKKAHRRTCRPP